MEELFYDYDDEYKEYTQDVLLETLINGRYELIMAQFKQFGKYGGTYTNVAINTKINTILGTKLNKHTTTQIFNYLFETERKGVKINNKFHNAYQIKKIK